MNTSANLRQVDCLVFLELGDLLKLTLLLEEKLSQDVVCGGLEIIIHVKGLQLVSSAEGKNEKQIFIACALNVMLGSSGEKYHISNVNVKLCGTLSIDNAHLCTSTYYVSHFICIKMKVWLS